MRNLAVAIISFFLVASAAAAESDWADCSAEIPERSIAGCTTVILEAKVAPHVLAVAYNNRGVAHKKRRELLLAFADYTEALRLNPSYAKAFYNRGLAHLEVQSFARALDDFDAAIRLDPNYAKAYASRGILLAEKAFVDEAIADLEAAFKSESALQLPANAAAAENLIGENLEGLTKYSPDKQLLVLGAAIKLGLERADLFAFRAAIHMERDVVADAIADLDQAIRLSPENADYWSSRCRAYLAQGAFEKAGSDCDEAVRLAPSDGSAYMNRGTLNLRRMKLADAEKDLSRAVQLLPQRPGPYLLRGQVHEKSGNQAKAFADYLLASSLTIAPDARQDLKDQASARSALDILRSSAVLPVDDQQRPSVSSPPVVKPRQSSTNDTLLKPGASFRDCAVCPEMIVVPSGEFLMGDAESGTRPEDGKVPQRRVRIPQRLAVGKYEITVEQFEAFVRATGYKVGKECSIWTGRQWDKRPGSFRAAGYEQTSRHPAACLNWGDAQAYVNWLTQQSGKSYRLPTEAEWEYVARAGSTTSYYFGDDANLLCRYGNVADRSGKERYSQWTVANCSDGHVHTAPVGSYKPNAFGLFDVHGNVSEWVEDCFEPGNQVAASDNSTLVSRTCQLRVQRGGSWIGHATASRSASRLRRSPDDRYSNIGLRVVRAINAN
jgi:formylglycine-generating enzyme required for sulfatase activity/Tfp pilus assembly protein PilF